MALRTQLDGILLSGHGTRSDVGTQQFLALVDLLARDMAPLPVEPAFLELQQPDIDTAIDRLLDRGIARVAIVPLLLFAAGHAKRDIPRQVRAALARRDRANVELIQAAHLGCHPALIELSRLRMEEALAQNDSTPAARSSRDACFRSDSCLLLVARGSHDGSATAEMHEFARLREQQLNSVKTEVAFLAMARPLLHEQLPKIAGRGYGRVIVQPHFLFHGELVASIERQMAQMAAKYPEQEWIVTPPLADKPGIVTTATALIQKVIWDRCGQAGIRVVVRQADD